MLRQHRLSCFIVIVVAIVWTANAQAQPGGGRRGGGFGMGGPGQGGVVGLVGLPPVQKEIGLEGAAAEKVGKLVSDFQESVRDEAEKAGVGPGSFQEIQSLPAEERETKMREMREKMGGITRKLNDKFLPQVKAALTPAQYERVQQIGWQTAGSRAFAERELSQALEVTKEQQEKIVALNQEFEKKMAEERAQGAGGNFQAMFAKMREMNKARDQKAVEVLSKEQQEKYHKLMGKPFDLMQQMMQGGFGGRGGPGGPGGAAGRPGAGRPQKKDSDKKE